jgi:hypothetical protein
MTNANRVDEIEEKVMYSIYKKDQKEPILVCTRKILLSEPYKTRI